MSAKHKLNAANINGCLLMAGIFGAASQSWLIFLILLVVFLGLSFHSKSIRL